MNYYPINIKHFIPTLRGVLTLKANKLMRLLGQIIPWNFGV